MSRIYAGYRLKIEKLQSKSWPNAKPCKNVCSKKTLLSNK